MAKEEQWDALRGTPRAERTRSRSSARALFALAIAIALPAPAYAQPPSAPATASSQSPETPTQDPAAEPPEITSSAQEPADHAPPPAIAVPAPPAEPAPVEAEEREAKLTAQKIALEDELQILERLVEVQILEQPLADFLPIDITDEEAVALLREELELELAALERRRDAPVEKIEEDEGEDEPKDAPTPKAGSTGTGTGSSTGTGSGSGSGAETRAGDQDDGALDEPVPVPVPEPEPEPEPEVDPLLELEREVLDLEIQVLSTRIAILSLPLAERERLMFEDEERQRSDEAQAAAESTANEAAQDVISAEAARQRALEAAQAARTSIQRKVAEERARAEGIRRDQAQLRGNLAKARHDFESRRNTDDWPGHGLSLEVVDIEPKSEAAAELYDQLVDALLLIWAEVVDALENAEDDREIPRYDPDLPSPTSDAQASVISDIKALRKTAVELEQAADELAEVSRTLALEILDATADHERELYKARIALLDKLPKAKYDAVLGLGRDGIAQLQRELRRLFLAGRWYRIQRRRAPARFLRDLGDFYTFAHYASVLLWLLFIGWLATHGIRNGSRYLDALGALAVRTIKRASLIRVVQWFLARLNSLIRPLVLLIAIFLVWPALGDLQAVPEIEAAYNLLLYIAIYRFGLHAAHVGIARLINRHIAPEVSAKILRSLKLIGWTALTIAIFLSVSERILGKGYLYRLVLGFAWIGALPIAAILIRWWRETIADAYLKFSGTGSMADAVRKTRGKWYGFFVATAAVSILFVVAIIRFARQFVLGFEQSRKALAFVFRRRLERQAEDLDDERPRILPQELVDHLSTMPVSPGDLHLDYFPHLDAWIEDLRTWRHASAVGATLLIGPRGNGKTSWLRAACERAAQVECEIHRVNLSSRVLTEEGLVSALAEELKAPAEAAESLAGLRGWLNDGNRRLIAIDDLHSLFLRGVDTNRAWDTLDDLIAETGRKVYWLASIERQPHDFLCWAYRGTGAFRKTIHLGGWPEEKIAELLHQRTAAAGYKVVYDDLVIDRVEGVEAQAQLVGTELEYARLLWDYADGSPAVALDCWRASLVSDGERAVRVRLFRRPPESQLEELGEPQRFLLAAVHWHGHLSPREAVLSLRYRLDVCTEGLDLLVEWGVLACHNGRYFTTIPWQPAIYRYLRRHHLIED